MNIEEAIEILENYYKNEDIYKIYKNHTQGEVGGTQLKFCLAIETVLADRERLILENKNKIIISDETYKTAIKLAQDEINKKWEDKIREKIEKLEPRIEQYYEYEKQQKQTDVEYYENIADTAIVQVLEELLKEGE